MSGGAAAAVPYVELIDRYLEEELTAAAFVDRYQSMFLAERTFFAQPVYEILNGIFADADEYVEAPRLRDGGPDEIDEPELHRRVSASRWQLRDLGL